jgi:scyllo-inositol 2-dehydrogenase (NADP+)
MPVVNTALLSFGFSGRVFHAPFVEAHPGFRLAGCWERSNKALTRSYPSAKSYDSLEQVLADPEIDLVVVNTPTATHYEFTRLALEHGKHVLVEKAFTSTADEAIRLAALAQEKHRKLAVYQNRRWDSDFLSVRGVLDEGRLGDIVEANLAFSRFNPALSPKAHREEPNPGAGIVKDLGPHLIDQALVLFGMPDALFADIGVTRTGSRVDDYFDILLWYGEQRVHLKSGCLFRQPTPEYTFFGKCGSFIKARSDVQEAHLQQGIAPDDPDFGREPDSAAGRLYTVDNGHAEAEDIVAPRGNYLEFYEGLHRAITRDGSEPVTAADGIRVMQVIDAAFRSQREGRVVRF